MAWAFFVITTKVVIVPPTMRTGRDTIKTMDVNHSDESGVTTAELTACFQLGQANASTAKSAMTKKISDRCRIMTSYP
ncbi:MAG: hypothetical protein ACI97A_000112 [Planctomycetota bacterium]